MNNKKIFPRLKMFFALILSLGVVYFGEPQLFVAGTTEFRTDLIARIQNNNFSIGWQGPSTGENGQDTESADTSTVDEGIPQESLVNTHPEKSNLDYKQIGNGIYAAEDPATGKRYIKIDRGTKLEKRYINVNGQDVLIYVPAQ